MTSQQKLITSILLCVSLLSIAGVVIFSRISDDETEPFEVGHHAVQDTTHSVSQGQVSTVAPIGGKLLLSLVPDSVGENALPLTYTYDLNAHVLVPTYNEVKAHSNVLPYHTSLSPDRKLLATLYLKTPFSNGVLEKSMRLAMMPFDGNMLTEISGDVSDPMSFGAGADSVGIGPRLPSVNNNGDIVLGIFPNNIKDKKVGFDYDIRYVSQTSGGVIAKGLFPHFVSNTRIVYLGHDGIHQYDFASRGDTLLTTLEGRDGKLVAPTPNMMLNVSRDGEEVAITNPDQLLVRIYKFGSDGMLHKYKQVDAYAFWPVFSPDGHTLAVQTLLLANTTNKDKPHPRIVFYDISKEKPNVMSDVVELDGFVHSAMFFTDWY